MITLIAHDPSRSGIWRYSLELFKALKRIDRANVIFVATPSTFMKAPSFEGLKPVYGAMIYATTHLFALTLNHDAHAYHILNATLSGHFKLKPLIVTVHDLIPFTLFKERASSWACMGWLFTYGVQRSMRKGLVNAEQIICVSESTKNDLLRFIDVDPRKVRVIYYGVDHELFKPRDKLEARRRLSLPLDRPIILNVGSEEPRKNIPTLIKAFGILVKDVPNAMLIRVGSPTNIIKKLIHSQGLEGKIVYLRPTDEALSLLYNASDVFVFPSYYEGLGLPLLEAMASGCPVIAGNRSAIPEAVGDGGILLDPFDVDGFAYWMREILSNEDLKNKLSERSYIRSMNFSWERCARETLEVYREVLNEV
jgi:glycosyltransferase involved in cell wall biosynthesis